MYKRVAYVVACLTCFLIGVYSWKIVHTGRKSIDESEQRITAQPLAPHATILFVGDSPITTDDLDWEFKLQTKDVVGNKALTPIPDVGTRYELELSPLRQRLVASIVERKTLYKYIEQDHSFDISNPARFTSCLKEWQEVLKDPAQAMDATDAKRLKNRICEKDIINQYLAEKIYPKLQISDHEILEYYKNHTHDFKFTERAIIRQVVLPTEGAAKQLRNRIDRANFEQMAKEHSITPEGQKGGLLGPFSRGEFTATFDVAFSMQVGEISGIVKSAYGFHIITLVKRLPKGEMSLADATPVIKKKLVRMRQEEEFQKWVEVALNSVPVKTPKPLW